MHRFSWIELWKKIHEDHELEELEKEGFHRGSLKGKTMDKPIGPIVDSLKKQWRDFLTAWYENDDEKIKRSLADLRNVAGCVFLKLKEKQEK